MTAKIALACMCRDEEFTIVPMLDSVKDFIDMAVILDTGSVDSTVQVVKDYFANIGKEVVIIEQPFVDFVSSKNFLLDRVDETGADWVLFNDADERLIAGGERLRPYTEDETLDAVAGWIVEGDLEQPTVNTYTRLRMWRTRPIAHDVEVPVFLSADEHGNLLYMNESPEPAYEVDTVTLYDKYRFSGPGVHEVILPIGRIMGDQNIKVYHDHRHRTVESYGKRFEAYEKLLKDALDKDPGDYRARFYYARTIRERGRLLDAIEQFELYLSGDSGYRDEKWHSAYDIALCWKLLGEYDRTLEACERALAIDSRRAEVVNLMGTTYFQMQQWDKALEYFKKAAEMPLPRDVVLFLDPRAYTVVPLNFAAVCLDNLGQYSEAIKYCERQLNALPKPDMPTVLNLMYLKKKLTLTWFFTLGKTPEPVWGSMLEETGCGGVETTYIEVPTNLANLGHNVFVFCDCEREHVYKGVNFIPYTSIEQYTGINPDVVVTSRWFSPICDAFQDAIKVIWLQDAWFADPGRPDAWQKADRIVMSSPWHRQYFAERVGVNVPTGKVKIIPLGINKSDFATLSSGHIERVKSQCIYSSNPNRGLHELMSMWGELTKRVPDIWLIITYGWEGLFTWSQDPGYQAQAKQQQEMVQKWAQQVGNVTFTGRLNKKTLYANMQKSVLAPYPNNFQETQCLTALETQACGVPMVTTRLGALPTTLNPTCNVLIDGNPRSPIYAKKFIEAVESLLTNPVKYNNYSARCMEYIISTPCDWSDVARHWEAMALSM